jgi:hypothetical protein
MAQYNQITNFVAAQSEINIPIGESMPAKYSNELALQYAGGPLKYGGITDRNEIEENLRTNCLFGITSCWSDQRLRRIS